MLILIDHTVIDWIKRSAEGRGGEVLQCVIARNLYYETFIDFRSPFGDSNVIA